MDGHDQPLRPTGNRAHEWLVASSLPTYRMKKLVAPDRPKATKGFSIDSVCCTRKAGRWFDSRS